MIDSLLNLIAPHYCCSCGEIGSLFCEGCKYDIGQDDDTACLLCGQPASLAGVCGACRPCVERGWYAGARSGGLERLIDRYKFGRAQAAHKPLGDLLLVRLPDLPAETIIVPIPTVASHVRQRGYDHTLLVARYIAKKRGLTCATPLTRLSSATQRGAGRKQRLTQAKTAFEVKARLRNDVPYLLIDDIVTTGATLAYAAKALRSAGATVVWAAAVARQPLENSRQ
jgi:ComF family protein